jgi:GT2 family glycosyltransferase
MVDISVIILNWNGRKWLKNCYNSLKTQTFKNFEIILADNASCDDSVEYTKALFSEVKIIKYKTNLGYAEANNQAAYKAQGKYLLFLNNDTKLEHKCLQELMKHGENRGCYICAVNFLDYNSNLSKLQDKIIGLGVDLFGYPVSSKNIFYSEGAALFIRKKLFIELEGFDKKHFIFAEDIDLSWRAQLQGHNICFVKSAIVYHEQGGTVTGSSKKGKRHITSMNRRYLTERNTLRNMLKNYSLVVLSVIFPIHLILLGVESLFFLLCGKAGAVKDIYLEALLYNIVILKDTLRARRKIQKQRIVSDIKILERITWNRFYKLEVLRKIGVPIIK